MQANEEHADVISEQRLWTAVVARAIEEWVSGTLRASREAENYLFNGGTDFEMVCQSAGLDARALRDKLVRLQKSGKGPTAPPTFFGSATSTGLKAITPIAWRAA
jgi:hypothetical protein